MSNSLKESSDSVPHVNPSPKDIARFWKFVPERPEDGCWHFDGYIMPNGYGVIWFRGKYCGAHRLSWMIHFGEIPKGMCICHKCDVRDCVRPDHLFIGTHDDNMADMKRKGRSCAGDKNGSRLHPELLPSGENHWSRFYPDSISRGDFHYSRIRPEVLARGERHGVSKLSDKKVIEMRLRYLSGESQRALAKVFGVNQTVVGDVVNRKTWKHVP